MNAKERRHAIQELLSTAGHPVSAAAMAAQFSISRQSIVGDIAILRASGINISATPRGYAVLPRQGGILRQIACKHSANDMEAELNLIVDQHCVVRDVIVEHPIYGQLTGSLQLTSRTDVQQFIQRCADAAAQPLSLLTEGIHLHTLACPDLDAFDRVRTALSALHILLE